MMSPESLLKATTGIDAVAAVEVSSRRISPPVASGSRLSSRMRPGRFVEGGLESVATVHGHVQLDVRAAPEQGLNQADVVLVVLDVKQSVVYQAPLCRFLDWSLGRMPGVRAAHAGVTWIAGCACRSCARAAAMVSSSWPSSASSMGLV